MPVIPALAYSGDSVLSLESLGDLSRAQWKQEENASSWFCPLFLPPPLLALLSAHVQSMSSAMNKQHHGLSAPNACSSLNSKPSFHKGFINSATPRHISYL